MWLYGKPGCGKSNYCTTILEDLLQRCDGSLGGMSAHYYFSYSEQVGDRSTSPPWDRQWMLKAMLRSVIGQLTQHCTQLTPGLETLLTIRGTGQSTVAISELLDVLQQMVHESSEVFLIIEALDECFDRDTQTELMLVLKTMAQWHLPGLHLLMTSRNQDQVKKPLTTFLGEEAMLCLDYEQLPKSGKDEVDKALLDLSKNTLHKKSEV